VKAASPRHVAFAASDCAAVAAFHRGAPGLRPQYHASYCGAFVLDRTGTTSRPSATPRPLDGSRRVQSCADAKRIGSLDNHRQEPWKLSLPRFIEDLYLQRFGRSRPEVVLTIEGRARLPAEKKAAKKARKAERRAARDATTAVSAGPKSK